MSQYLEKFAGTINKRQSEQILKLLSKQRNSGQIRSVQEFTQKLQDLMFALTSSVLTPSLQLWMAKNGKGIDSETYNFMLERVEDDLIAAFEESININEVQQSHEAIIRDVILKNLRAGVAELESKITLFEFLNKDNRGFDSAIFSTFRESREGRTQRQGVQAQLLFQDPRKSNELIPTTQDATVELVGERLILATSNSSFYTITDVRQIFDSSSPQSELVVEPPGTNLRNMIDNTQGTYWVQSLLFAEKKESVSIQLEFNLGTIREVDLIEIEPASQFGIIVENISYADGNNVIINLDIPETQLDSVASLRFRKIATNRIILTLRNENSRKISFKYNNEVQPLFGQALAEPPLGIQPSFETVSTELIQSIPSTAIQDAVGLSVPILLTFGGYEFITGIDNVRIGISEHENRSIYISSPLSAIGIGELGIRTVESRPYLEGLEQQVKFTKTTYDINQDSSLTDDEVLVAGNASNTYFQSSIEYWIIKQDLGSNGELLRTSTFPILPLDKDRIYHERLVLINKSISTIPNPDLGKTMFFTTRTDGNVKIYRNGILLLDETDDVLGGTGWEDISTVPDRTPGNTVPMQFQIQVLSILPGDIFTISYTPVVSSSQTIPKTLTEFAQIGGLNTVDLVGDLSARVGVGQVIILDRIGEDDFVQDSNIFLAIILRQNTAEPTLTSAVEEYTLMGGRKDTTKFEEN